MGANDDPPVTQGSYANHPIPLSQYAVMHQWRLGYKPHLQHLVGILNILSDDASQCWDLNDAEFLTHFNSTYPQDQDWTLLEMPPGRISSLIKTLQWRPRHIQSRRSTELKSPTSLASGPLSATTLEFYLMSKMFQHLMLSHQVPSMTNLTSLKSSSSSPTMDPLLPVVNLSQLNM